MYERMSNDPVTIPGTPAGGYHRVADIVATNNLKFRPGDNALDVAIEIVSTHAGGGPVVGADNEFLGFINEGDLIRALERGIDLTRATAEQIMNTSFIGVTETTPLSSVADMFQMGFRILPVVQDGKVVRSITRHDLLRARLGIGPSIEE